MEPLKYSIGALSTPSWTHCWFERRDHLAGRIAVELSGALQKCGVIRPCGERDYELGRAGQAWFANLGIDTDSLRRSRRIFARQCLDWTERRPHIAGALGAALCSRLLALGWIACRRDSRVTRITPRGARELHSRLGLTA